MSLDDLSTAQLEAEVAKRKAVEAENLRREREARQVEVICPACDGLGRVRNYSIRASVGEEDEWDGCRQCDSRGWFPALLRVR